MLGTARGAENSFFMLVGDEVVEKLFYAGCGKGNEWSKCSLKLGFLLEVGVDFRKTSD